MNDGESNSRKHPVRDFIHRFVVSTFAVAIAVKIVPGIQYGSWGQLLLAAAVLGLLNAFVRPLLMLGCLPLLILTLGLFLLVINATLLWLTGELVDGFEVTGVWPAFWGALVISLVTIFINRLTGHSELPIQFQRRRSEPERERKRPDDDDGPVIDV